MASTKRHLVIRRGGRSACGLADPRHWTFDPAQVTCIGCGRTVQMADAEVAKQTKQTK